MSLLQTYEILKTKKVDIASLLEFHFTQVLNSIRRRLTPRQKFRNPWTIEVQREIFSPAFIELYRAVKDYIISFGREVTVERNSKGVLKLITIKFTHKGAFKFHLSKIAGIAEN